MAFNPNAVWISPSSIGDFEKCAQLYYLRNVYRNPKTGLKIQLLNSSLALGQIIHDVLEQFCSGEIADRQEKKCWELFDQTWARVCCDDQIFNSKEDQGKSKERGKSMLQRFLAHEHFKNAEKADFPSFPKADLGDDIMLTGKLDWIEKDSEGKYTIIDFKTGKNEEREDSIQLPVYAFLAGKVLKVDPVKINMKYWYLDKDPDWIEYVLPDLSDLETNLKMIGSRMKLVRETKSFACSRGGESCWACKDMLAVSRGEGKLIAVDAVNRKQEIYILVRASGPMEVSSDLPF